MGADGLRDHEDEGESAVKQCDIIAIWHKMRGGCKHFYDDAMPTFLAITDKAEADEREICARIAFRDGADDVADRIRSRGK